MFAIDSIITPKIPNVQNHVNPHMSKAGTRQYVAFLLDK